MQTSVMSIGDNWALTRFRVSLTLQENHQITMAWMSDELLSYSVYLTVRLTLNTKVFTIVFTCSYIVNGIDVK